MSCESERNVPFPELTFSFVSGCQGAILLMLTGLSFYFKKQNAKADRGELSIEGDAKFRYTI